MRKIIKFIFAFITLFSLAGCNSSEKQVKTIDIKLTDENYAFVIKKGNVALQESFNEFLNEIKEDGTFDEIVAKYFEGIGEKKGVEYVTAATTLNDDNTFVVATNCPFSPFEYIDSDGLMYGIDIEIAKLYAESTNQDLVVKNIDFDSIFTNVDSNYADIGMAGITVTNEREMLYDFTIPYYSASQKLVVSSNNDLFDNCVTPNDVEKVLKELKDVSLGYQIGTTGNWYVEGDDDWGFDGFDNVEGKGYKTAQLAIQDIVNGQLMGVVVDEAPGTAIVNSINDNSSMNWANKFKIFTDAIKQPKTLELVLTGLLNTLLIAVIGLVIGIVIGTLIAIVKVAPKYKKVMKVLDKICDAYVSIFRGTPIVVQLLVAYYVLLPMLSISGVSALAVGIVVFGLNSGAYVSEIMRGGINSVDSGQLEAGRALGLSYNQTMIRIVIPQALKNILPTLGNEFISLIKETSVVSFITIVDLYTAFNTIGTNTYSVVVPYLFMAVIYVLLVVIISLLIKLIERRLAKNDRSHQSK